MFPDFSGKYHGKINEKISRKTAEKLSKMQLQEKRLKQRNYQNLKGKHDGKSGGIRRADSLDPEG